MLPPRSTAARVVAPQGGAALLGAARRGGMQPQRDSVPWLWLALVAVAALLYFYGLNSPYAPTNGDEMVYIHIARMTAESGHWLPLQSEIIATRNTKPPLLFWQAIAAGDWGRNWNLFILRLPSVLYTFATTALLAFFAHRISGRLRTACIAAALYLLFFSTFRYGRAYLTSAPETFWLALPMWWLLWLRVRNTRPDQQASTSQALTSDSGGMDWRVFTLMGIAMGLGSAYKSFALVAPAAAAVWCAWLLSAPRLNWPLVIRSTIGLAWSTALAIGIFALWFVLDPDPASIWQEFVLAENAGKMSNTRGYWHAALFGAYPMWTQLLAYPINAGLLFFTVLGLGWVALKVAFKRQTYVQLTPALRVLLAWAVVWLVVFTIPSQRSERYLIPAMPAIAIAMALAWDRIAKAWFWITLALAVPALVMLARVAWVMGDMQIASNTQVAITLIVTCIGLTWASAGFLISAWSKTATLVVVLAVYTSFGLMVQPLSTFDAGYNTQLRTQMRGKRVAVPNGFTGQFERYHFVLRGARITPYDAEGRNTAAFKPELPPAERLDFLLGQFDAVVWLQDRLDQPQPSCLPRCTLLGSRWHVKSRHKAGEVTLQNIWYPNEWLFRREWLVAKSS
ncbi:MAG: phospholipid carrier-dependent glycosyltransferase [Pseudomonadota bacterium]